MATSVWTDDLVDRLKILWREGRSAAEVARAFKNGVTRSAVLGKVHRLGLSDGRISAKAAAPRVKPMPAARGRPTSAPRVKASPLRIAMVAAPTSGTATILSVGRFDCRWPYGDPERPGFALCGRKVARGAFCAAHAAIGYRPGGGEPDSLLRMAGLS